MWPDDATHQSLPTGLVRGNGALTTASHEETGSSRVGGAALDEASLRGEQSRAEAEQQAADRDQLAADYEANCGEQSPRQATAYGMTRAIRRRASKARRVASSSRLVAAGLATRRDPLRERRAEPGPAQVADDRAASLAVPRSRLAAIVEFSHDAILAKDLDGTVTAWNPAAQRLYGHTEQQIIGRPVAVLIPPELAEESAFILAEVLAGRVVPAYDTERITRGGDRIAVSVTVSPIRDATGTLIGASAIAHDISERLEAQAERAWTHELVRQSTDAIIALDTAGRITIWNPAARRLFGYSQHEAVGHRLAELVLAREPSEQTNIDESVLRARQAYRYEAVLQHRSGREVTAEINITPLDPSRGRLAGAVVCIRDVTGDRESARRISDGQARESGLSRELEQTRRFESVGQLSSGIAHDFNHFLGVILNLADLIVTQSPQGSTVRGDATEISAAAKRAAALVRQLLTFSHREAVEVELLDPGQVVAELQEFLRRALGARVTLQISVEPGPWVAAIDRSQLEQIIVNLAVNARDAMPTGGAVTIQTRTATATDSPAARPAGLSPGNYVTLTVSDTGTGMAPDVVQRALEPFFTTKGKDQGTGLGLATVNRIATQAGGAVTIESEPGQGTAVSVYLPVATRAGERR